MKQKDILKKEESELENVKKFKYHEGSISRLDAELSPEEQRERTNDRIKAGECLRCGEPLEEGAEKCRNCGKLKKLTT
jgi:ribosomal protein L40E